MLLIISTTVLIRHLGQLKTVVFQNWANVIKPTGVEHLSMTLDLEYSSRLTTKYYTKLEKLARDKNSSLLRKHDIMAVKS